MLISGTLIFVPYGNAIALNATVGGGGRASDSRVGLTPTPIPKALSANKGNDVHHFQ